MSETNSQEPTMEEILASIRRIISEDDAPAPPEEAPAAVHDPEPEPLMASAEDDVLELTDRLDEPPAVLETVGDLDVFPSSAPEPPPRPAPPPVADLPPLMDDEPLVGMPAASTAASAFGQLQRSVLMPAAGRTLEDVVRELLRPMMKAWLDENLPSIVEQQVAAEIERVARLRRQS